MGKNSTNFNPNKQSKLMQDFLNHFVGHWSDVGTKFLVLTNLAKIMVSPSLTDTGVPVFSPPRRPHKEHTPVLRYHQSMKPLVSSDHLCNLGGLSDG